ncbi:MAG: hypothetical protein KJ804_18375 [Proteobacteria bacterium]|nr:hypothetical protein [Pseudomonadota bacterium]MBU1060275.1 hypothetical protein [Pseudomonadota bacterium]
MKILICGGAGYITSGFNLGNGTGFSIFEIIKAAEKVAGKKIAYDVENEEPVIRRCCLPIAGSSRSPLVGRHNLSQLTQS